MKINIGVTTHATLIPCEIVLGLDDFKPTEVMPTRNTSTLLNSCVKVTSLPISHGS